nr:hypothetical protein [Acetobacter fallax]
MGLVSGGPSALADEVSAGGYARLPVSFTSPGDGRRTVAVSSAYSFGLATEDWGLVTGLALYATLTPGGSPVATWSVQPVTVSAGHTYTVPVGALSLLIETQQVFAEGDVLGVSAEGAGIIAGQTLSVVDGVVIPVCGGDSDSGSLTIAQLNTALVQLMQSLPQDDPGDGQSLWVNSNLLAISQKS